MKKILTWVKPCRNNSNLALIFLQSIDDLPNVDAILVVYSVDDEQSFNEAVQNIQFIRKEKVCNQAIILVANKADLERRRVVSEKGILVYQDCSLAWSLV